MEMVTEVIANFGLKLQPEVFGGGRGTKEKQDSKEMPQL